MYKNIVPALKPVRVGAPLSEMFACTKTRIRHVAAALWDRLPRGFVWLLSQLRLAISPGSLSQRQPIQSARDHKAKSPRRRSRKVNKDGSGKTERKPKNLDADRCTTWIVIDRLGQANRRPDLRRIDPLGCYQMVDQVSRIDYVIDTTDLTHSQIQLSYFIRDSRTGEQRRVEHSVELATSAGSWWFVDAGRLCKELCLAPGGDRFAHPELYGIVLDSQGNALAQPARREPSKMRVTKRAAKKVTWRLARYRASQAARRWWRAAISSLTRALKGQWITATMLAFWKRTGAST